MEDLVKPWRACKSRVRIAIDETKNANEPLLDDDGLLSDELQDRLEDVSKKLELHKVYDIVITATAWDDSYAPLTTSPTGMLRQLAYACLIDEAKEQVNLSLIA
jgi:hypothetical protein